MCFLDMKIMSLSYGGDAVNNESAGRLVYQITTIPSYQEDTVYYSVYYISFSDVFNEKERKKITF